MTTAERMRQLTEATNRTVQESTDEQRRRYKERIRSAATERVSARLAEVLADIEGCAKQGQRCKEYSLVGGTDEQEIQISVMDQVVALLSDEAGPHRLTIHRSQRDMPNKAIGTFSMDQHHYWTIEW